MQEKIKIKLLTPTTRIAMLIQVHALPSTQGKPAIANGNVETDTHHARLDMPWHVVVAFHGVTKRSISVPLCWDYTEKTT